jgi:DNA-directed RNA polymerase subunit omega
MATEETEEIAEATAAPEIDSKYRLIILAAKRSKQLQRGARPRIDIDTLKHKNTRIALEEVMRGRVNFSKTDDGDGKEPE